MKESNKKSKKICVIGTWHLGCVVASCLAEKGHQVEGVDFDRTIISNLKKGVPPLFEPGLEELIKSNIASGRLNFGLDFQTALRGADFAFITFDTPVDDRDQSDLTPILSACAKIARYSTIVRPTVVISSQIPVGRCAQMQQLILRKNPRLKPNLIYNPENLRLGQALETFNSPDRIIIGAENKTDAQPLLDLYDSIPSPKIVMSRESAEIVKHALNSYLATSISFMNEIANLCEETSANVQDVVRALKTDSRIGPRAFLSPGMGFSGGTLARDLQILREVGQKKGLSMRIVRAALEVNRERVQSTIKKLSKNYKSLKHLRCGILGLTYKPGTSTLRRSVALELAQSLAQKGADVKAYDPMVPQWPRGEKKAPIQLCNSAYAVAKDSQCLILVTEWPEFRQLDYQKILRLMRTNGSPPILIDTKNILEPAKMTGLGFKYLGTGVTVQ